MSLSLEYLDAALEDAKSAADWYLQRNASAADGFADEIDAAVAAIERLPEAWPVHDHGTHRYLLRRYPFSIVYRIEPARILIIAVAQRIVGLATGSCGSRDDGRDIDMKRALIATRVALFRDPDVIRSELQKAAKP